MTLYEMLGTILYNLNPDMDSSGDSRGRIDNEQITADFPHSREFASCILVNIMEKFDACTEKERRKITRSDAEFAYIVGSAIALRCGFNNIEEAFDIVVSKLNIPKMKRGKERFWNEIGDPDPEMTPEDEVFHSKMNELINEIVIKFSELYPRLYANIKDHYTAGKLVLNTSYKDKTDTMHRLSKKPDLKEFRSFAVPMHW